MPEARRYRVVRPLSPARTGPVIEAQPEDDPESRVIIWPGSPPPGELPFHPAIARPGQVGRSHGGGVWVEAVPAGCLLRDLPPPLPPAMSAWVVIAIAEALAALHEAGRAHGGLDAQRVHLSAEGQVILLGTGVEPGDAAADLAVLHGLYAAMDRQADPVSADSAAGFADALRERLGGHPGPPSELGVRVRRAIQPVPEDARRIEIVTQPRADRWAVDEIGFDLGPEEGGRGLLDPWTRSGSGSTGEVTGAERTGALDEWQDGSRARTTALARLARGLHADLDPARLGPQDPRAMAPLRALLAEEPLDTLPVPDGVPLGVERGAEPATRPGVPAPVPAEEVTGTVPGVVSAPHPPPEPAPEPTVTVGRIGVEVGLPLLLLAVLLAVVAGGAALWLFSRAF
jgi:hypothetical protein